MSLFVLKTEIEELKSLGFSPNGFLFGQVTCPVCISFCLLVFCFVFSFISSACLSPKGTVRSVKKFQFHR